MVTLVTEGAPSSMVEAPVRFTVWDPPAGIVWASGVLPAAVECTSTQPAPVVVVTVTV